MPSVKQVVLEKLQKLSPEDQEKVLNFVDSLSPLPPCATTPARRQPLRGRLAHLHLRITESDIAEVREELWPSGSRK